jgi:hypothetical protein
MTTNEPVPPPAVISAVLRERDTLRANIREASLKLAALEDYLKRWPQPDAEAVAETMRKR